MWIFLGTISGLTFGVLEERLYAELAIAQVAKANAVSQADAGVLDFAFRVFVDGFEHAVRAGVAAFFIGDRDRLSHTPLVLAGDPYSGYVIDRAPGPADTIVPGDPMVMEILSEPEDTGRS